MTARCFVPVFCLVPLRYNECMVRGVDFGEKGGGRGRRSPNCRPFLERWAKKLPGIRTRRQANIFLLFIALICLAGSVAVLNATIGTGFDEAEPTYIEDIPKEEREELPPELLNSLPSRTQ